MGTGTGDRLLARVRLPRADDSPRAQDLFLERSKRDVHLSAYDIPGIRRILDQEGQAEKSACWR